MAAAGVADPAGHSTPESIAANGDCYRLRDGESEGVFVLEKHGEQLWVSGAGAVGSKGLAANGMKLVQAMAQQSGLSTVAFQTGRPGLVKLAKKQGFRVVGFIMEKSVQ